VRSSRRRSLRPVAARRRDKPGGRRTGRPGRRLPAAAAVAALVAVSGAVAWIAAGAGSGDAREARPQAVAVTGGAVRSDDRSGERARQLAAERRRERAAAARREQVRRRARRAAVRRTAERRQQELREERRRRRAAGAEAPNSRPATPEPVAVATPAPVQPAPPSSERSGGSESGGDPPEWFLDLDE